MTCQLLSAIVYCKIVDLSYKEDIPKIADFGCGGKFIAE
jgi:hypothetical protein